MDEQPDTSAPVENAHLAQRVAGAVDLAERALRACAAAGGRPAVLTSFGKDSMVLLHLARAAAARLGAPMPDCICLTEPMEAGKYAWGQRVAEKWDLRVYDWQPSLTAMQQEGDEFEVQNYYTFGRPGGTITCPTGIVPMPADCPPDQWRKYLCAFDDLYCKVLAPVDGIRGPWTHFLVGHRGDDADPIYGGDAGTRIDWRIVPGVGEFVFPLREWSEADIWDATELYGIPVNRARYKGRAQDMDDLGANPDYFHACTRCLDRRPEAPHFVECPRRGGARIENVAAKVRWADQTKPSYMRD